MQFRFSTDTRPKNVAKHFRGLMLNDDIKLTVRDSQAAIADMAGYTDWKEMRADFGDESVEDCSVDRTTLLARWKRQEEALVRAGVSESESRRIRRTLNLSARAGIDLDDVEVRIEDDDFIYHYQHYQAIRSILAEGNEIVGAGQGVGVRDSWERARFAPGKTPLDFAAMSIGWSKQIEETISECNRNGLIGVGAFELIQDLEDAKVTPDRALKVNEGDAYFVEIDEFPSPFPGEDIEGCYVLGPNGDRPPLLMIVAQHEVFTPDRPELIEQNPVPVWISNMQRVVFLTMRGDTASCMDDIVPLPGQPPELVEAWMSFAEPILATVAAALDLVREGHGHLRLRADEDRVLYDALQVSLLRRIADAPTIADRLAEMKIFHQEAGRPIIVDLYAEFGELTGRFPITSDDLPPHVVERAPQWAQAYLEQGEILRKSPLIELAIRIADTGLTLNDRGPMGESLKAIKEQSSLALARISRSAGDTSLAIRYREPVLHAKSRFTDLRDHLSDIIAEHDRDAAKRFLPIVDLRAETNDDLGVGPKWLRDLITERFASAGEFERLSIVAGFDITDRVQANKLALPTPGVKVRPAVDSLLDAIDFRRTKELIRWEDEDLNLSPNGFLTHDGDTNWEIAINPPDAMAIAQSLVQRSTSPTVEKNLEILLGRGGEGSNNSIAIAIRPFGDSDWSAILLGRRELIVRSGKREITSLDYTIEVEAVLSKEMDDPEIMMVLTEALSGVLYVDLDNIDESLIDIENSTGYEPDFGEFSFSINPRQADPTTFTIVQCCIDQMDELEMGMLYWEEVNTDFSPLEA